MDVTLKCDYSLETYEAVLSCGAVLLSFTQFVILEHLSILDAVLSGVKGLKNLNST